MTPFTEDEYLFLANKLTSLKRGYVFAHTNQALPKPAPSSNQLPGSPLPKEPKSQPIEQTFSAAQTKPEKPTLKAPENKPATKEVEKQEEKIISDIKTILPKPVQKPKIDELKDLKELFAKKFPKLPLFDVPLNDAKAKSIKTTWKELQVVPAVLLLYQKASEKTFLDNVAKAISRYFDNARAFSLQTLDTHHLKKMLSDKALSLILLTDDALMASQILQSLYREFPQENTKFIEEIPLILLPSISLYQQDPKLKASLWKLLCHKLAQK